jgi:hypothetical protein
MKAIGSQIRHRAVFETLESVFKFSMGVCANGFGKMRLCDSPTHLGWSSAW